MVAAQLYHRGFSATRSIQVLPGSAVSPPRNTALPSSYTERELYQFIGGYCNFGNICLAFFKGGGGEVELQVNLIIILYLRSIDTVFVSVTVLQQGYLH